MTKLVEFDSERFLADAEKELAKRGAGSRELLCKKAGLSHATISYCFRNRRVTDIEVIMSIAQYLGLVAFSYRIVRTPTPEPQRRKIGRPSAIYDWKLFSLCASMICWGKSSILARQVEGMSIPTAAAILKGSGTTMEFMKPLCSLMGVPPEKFLRATRRYGTEKEPRRYHKKTKLKIRKQRRSSRRLRPDNDDGSVG